MDEQEWLECDDPQRLLYFLFGEVRQEDGSIAPLRAKGLVLRRPNDRQQLQFCCACCRRIWPLIKDTRSREAVVVAERFADGEASEEELRQATLGARNAWCELSESEDGRPAYLAWGNYPFHFVSEKYGVVARLDLVEIIRDVFGNPFRPRPPRDRKADILWQEGLTSWLSWNGGTVVKIAQSIYNHRAFDEMPILGDGLEESGCGDIEMLTHCRQSEQHVLGCWLLDLLLEKR